MGNVPGDIQERQLSYQHLQTNNVLESFQKLNKSDAQKAHHVPERNKNLVIKNQFANDPFMQPKPMPENPTRHFEDPASVQQLTPEAPECNTKPVGNGLSKTDQNFESRNVKIAIYDDLSSHRTSFEVLPVDLEGEESGEGAWV